MKNFLINLFKLVLSLAIIIFGEEYIYKLIDFLKIDLSSCSTTVSVIINIVIELLIAFCVYIIYKEYIIGALRKYKYKLSKNNLYCLIAALILVLVISITNYICNVVGNSFHLDYIPLKVIEILNRPVNIDLIIDIINHVIIIPFIITSAYVLGVSNTFKEKLGIVLSIVIYVAALLYEQTNAFSLDIGASLLNMVPYAFLIGGLSYLNYKNNYMFSYITYAFYIVLQGLLIGVL